MWDGYIVCVQAIACIILPACLTAVILAWKTRKK